MGVSHGAANLLEHLQSLRHVEPVFVAILSDWSTLDVFHDEIRPPAFSASSIEQTGNVLMLQIRKYLAFDLESAHHGLAEFLIFSEHLDSHLLLEANRSGCQIDRGKPAMADSLVKLVRPDAHPQERIFGRPFGKTLSGVQLRWPQQKVIGDRIGSLKKPVYFPEQLPIGAAGRF